MSKVDVQIAKSLIESFGYEANYYKTEQFFKIFRPGEKLKSLHLSVNGGKAEFVFSLVTGQGKYGGTYPGLAIDSGYEGNFRNPYFRSYGELKTILNEGLSLFEEIKSVIDP